ncbi:hypothetical protein C2845_PMPSC055482 [Panicum miliaceum]|uniref:Uncharacterized protein n=1 Tax=Panicum miliaceum TaxID=4540 RepID=A0A3L6P9P5_PANMI|nr:hypothetical protein C2845_PMPSC055482 [Panicum miliaceum]
MVLHQEPGGGAVPCVHGCASSEAEQLDLGPPTPKKGRAAFLERALRKCSTEEGFGGARLFSTIRARRVIHLAMRTTRMWQYTSPADPDRVSPEEMPDDEVWSWVELVLKVGNQQTIGGSDALDKGHPPNLGLGHPQSHPHLPKGAAGATKQPLRWSLP